MFGPCEIEIFRTRTGKEPFSEWLKSLDRNSAGRIDARIARIRQTGSLGDCEPVGEGVYELKFHFGPGYRIYFGYDTHTLLIFLLGGYKKRQQKNIDQATEYWHDYQKGKK